MASNFFYSAYQFAAIRFFTGMGLFFYFVTRNSYAPELSSYNGILIKLSALGVPNLFSFLSSGAAIRTILIFLAFLGILLAFGVMRRIAVVVLLIGYICSIGGIPILPEPFSGFVLGLFLILLLAPSGEPLNALSPPTPFQWKLPQWQYWLLFGLSIIGFAFTAYQTNFSELPSPNVPLNFGNRIFVVMAILIFLQLSFLYRPIRSYTWMIFSILSVTLLTNSISSALFLVAFITLLLPSNTRFPWQEKESLKEVGTIFVDGECVVCDEFATVVLEEDIWHKFKIATLQGEEAKRELPEELRKSLSTVVLKINGECHIYSTAVLEILKRLPGLWAFAVLDQILVPRRIRDSFYKNFAKIRYRVFGKKEVCSLPSPKDKARILD